MPNNKYPHFVIINKAQKGGYQYSDLLTKEILSDVCMRVTGCTKFTVEFVNKDYNKGRLAIIEYRGAKTFVSFSDKGKIASRNSFFQSLTTALIQYYQDPNANKRICFYFLPLKGNFKTDYFKFMYRLMATAGVEFLNANESLGNGISPFTTVDDLIMARNNTKIRNRSNNPTFLARSSNGKIQLYGKTYGANKKEATLLCIALSCITDMQIELFEIREHNLTKLPKPDSDVINSLGNVKIISTDLKLERKELEKEDSLRSPEFIYNLFVKFGSKKCALCECEIPELIEGAHIWPVAEIKREPISIEKKIKFAIDGENGIWLCENHHTMLDENMLMISYSGKILCKQDLEDKSKKYIWETTPTTQLTPIFFTNRFSSYLKKRYNAGTKMCLLNEFRL